MKIETGFLVTPIGEKDSPERAHADRIKTEIFNPLGYELECKFDRANTNPQSAIVARSIFLGIQNADIVIADTMNNNPNVLYEIGMAHAMNKPVIIINPDGNILPFDIRHFTYISYNQVIFDNPEENTAVIASLRGNIRQTILNIKDDNKDDPSNFLPSYSNLIKDSVPSVITGLLTQIEGLLTKFNNNSTIIAEYIEGEDNAFRALSEAMKRAHKSIRSTRFSQPSVRARQNDFFNIIRQIMDTDIYPNGPCELHRIIATNDETKEKEIKELVDSNLGRNLNIYLSKYAYDFEIVIIDEETVFIHFNKNKKEEVSQNNEIISSTLKFTNYKVASKFIEIFECIKTSPVTFHHISCEEIKEDNKRERYIEIEKKFNEGLNHFINDVKGL